ncbi:SEL1-like repeat protein [Catenisphaera adipataccumulans]|jgi:TPR repeat protein|uniref:TPR repeat protein n=1 Tax=Catenisphaera adipataccumulans TaxID=700500 RepID=A0A7W8FWC7_9FIRM|nr:SEL1-like repeat protein [Catenisphaera adipataccumulans]MBB5182560.1 TPR repeat protein [Catenisphaera adipataccumulans]
MAEEFNMQLVKQLKEQKKYTELYRYCRTYALQNNLDAICELAGCFYHGWGTAKNEQESALLDYQAAKCGHVKSIYNLAVDYEQGIGVMKNPEKAKELYDLAAKQGDTDAMFSLGMCYFHGHGTAKSLRQALDCFSEAAACGHARAQCALGFCYREGLGTKKDLIKSDYWLNLAADNGNALAAKYVDRDVYKEEIHEALDSMLADAKNIAPLLKQHGDEMIEAKIERIIALLRKHQQEA